MDLDPAHQLQEVHARSPDGYEVPIYYGKHTTSQAVAQLLLLPALGIEARFYRRLASALNERGVDVALLEQRGHGRSALRPSRRCDFGWKEMLGDLDVAFRWLGAESEAPKRLLMGHSLGGHHAAMYAGQQPREVHGVVLAATGTPWVGAYEGATKSRIRLLRTIAGPLGAIAGYYPGKRVGFGGREARAAMRDWVALAGTNEYAAAGTTTDFDAPLIRYPGRVLALRMQDDDFAPEPAVEAVLGKFGAAPITRVCLTAEEIGGRADHNGWAKHPDAAAGHIAEWCSG